jgi:hypothetical protein
MPESKTRRAPIDKDIFEPISIDDLKKKFENFTVSQSTTPESSPASSTGNTPTKSRRRARDSETHNGVIGGTKRRRRSLRKLGKRSTKKAKRTFRRK